MSVSSRKSSKESKKSEESKDSKPERTEISDADKALIEELRGKIKRELDLLPAYNDDISLLRWLVGWDRKVDVVVPKIKFSLRSIYALGLHKEDLSTLDKITDYCDACSVPLQWLPGSLVGIDKDGNVLSLQMIGRLDAPSLMPCTRNSDLYRMRIAESEGVMSIIRERERLEGRQLGTSVIFDLDGMSMSMVDTVALKTIMTMLSQLQEMFPDVLRKIFVINVPNFIQLLWSLIVPALAKQTQQKIEILGDNWKDRLKEAIGDEVLFERWGGTRKHEKGEYGFVRQGGKAPAHLKYDKANDIPDAKLTSLKVSARNTAFVPIVVDGPAPTTGKRRLYWWWRVDSGDVGFSVLRAGDGRESVAEHDDDDVIHPRWRLQTVYVPEDGEVDATEPGTYKLVFDNTHGKVWAKNIKYFAEVRIVE